MTTFAYSSRETNSGIVYDFGIMENDKLKDKAIFRAVFMAKIFTSL